MLMCSTCCVRLHIYLTFTACSRQSYRTIKCFSYRFRLCSSLLKFPLRTQTQFLHVLNVYNGRKKWSIAGNCFPIATFKITRNSIDLLLLLCIKLSILCIGWFDISLPYQYRNNIISTSFNFKRKKKITINDIDAPTILVLASRYTQRNLWLKFTKIRYILYVPGESF